MQLGISHYPEYYAPERWAKHFELVAEGGFKFIRFGESSWASFQPAPNVFCWETLDAAIEMAASFGIAVVLGTPTYVPPRWLVECSPDILPVGADGRRTVFGARQHRCFNSPAYGEAADQITNAMVSRYGQHPNVVAWQIDNELGGEQKRCFCDNCRREFQVFLQERYQSIEELNRRWNTSFWGQQYSNFEQIAPPYRFNSDLEMRHHPALELDFQRFSSQSIVRFCERQYDIMRPLTDRPITHNTDTFYWGDNVNVHHLFRKLDVAGIDIYSDKLFEVAFYSDLARSVSRTNTFWMLEFGTRSSNIRGELEAVRSRGCERFFFFKLLPFPWGQEIDRKALITLTGTPEPNYHVVKTWAAEHSADDVDETPPPRVGLFYDFDSSWAYFVDQWRAEIAIPDRQVYPRYIIEVVYQAIFDLGLHADIVFDAESLDLYDYVLVPRHLLYDPELASAMVSYVAQGGNLLATTDLFRRNPDNAWLECVPDVYRSVFAWSGRDFPDDTTRSDAFSPIQNRLGKGCAWLLHKDSTKTLWQSVLDPKREVAASALPHGECQVQERVFDQRGKQPKSLLNECS